MSSGSRLRVLFLHPKTLFDSWPFPVDTLGEVVRVPSLVYPLLAATVEHLPLDLEIFDGYVAPSSFRAYKERLARADVLAITVMAPLKALDTEVTIRLAKRLNPRVKVILGGNHASAFAERWIACGADFVIVREAETAFPALVQRLLQGGDSFADLPNLVYRSEGGAATRSAVSLDNIPLDDSPFPAWSRMDLSPYDPRLGPGGPAATVEISRGCPHRCDFCNINKFWGYSQRYKSVDRVMAELERLHRLGVRQLFFADDNFGHDHEHTCRLMEAMIRADYRFAFGAFVRGDTVHKHPDFAPLAARAGLRLALMGIETLDKKWLKEHRKGVRAGDVVQMWTGVYAAMKRNGIFVLGLFINPTGDAGPSSGTGLDGKVCDYHYSADLLPQKNSALFDNLLRDERVEMKDMFYHDWNMPPLRAGGVVQSNRKTLSGAFEERSTYGLRALASKSRLERHFRWTNLGIFLERLACTTPDDVRRYRIAKDARLPLEERQRLIVGSVLNDEVLDQLVRSDHWRSPLAIRLALRRAWSGAPGAPVHEPPPPLEAESAPAARAAVPTGVASASAGSIAVTTGGISV
jgi:anaerobic magnesium-protoporphyrin IX monomethyl ester cyclase